MDNRLKLLSYSSLQTLHSCPRKYQLYKLGAAATEDTQEQTITFSFGHVVGLGVQLLFQNKTTEEIIFEMFKLWAPDLYAEDVKRCKSFWYAVSAIKKLIAMKEQGLLDGWELLYVNGVPACELGFKILLPDNYSYRGFVDLVLVHRETKKVMVIECKTLNARFLNPAQYKNSAQAIGYSIILDHYFPDLSSYEVTYLVYLSPQKEWQILSFHKSYLQRALWLQELLLDKQTVQMYEDCGVYPMHGESCYDYFTECKYLGTCTLSTEYLTLVVKDEPEDDSKYLVIVSFEDLIKTQLAKA